MNLIEQAYVIRATMDEVGAILTPEQAAQYPYLYRQWDSKPDVSAVMTLSLDEEINPQTAYFNVGARRRYKDVVYECIEAHSAEINVTPDMSPDKWMPLVTSL